MNPENLRIVLLITLALIGCVCAIIGKLKDNFRLTIGGLAGFMIAVLTASLTSGNSNDPIPLSTAARTAQSLLRGEAVHLTYYSDLSMMQAAAVDELGLSVSEAQRVFSHTNMTVRLVVAPTNHTIATNK